MLQQGLAHFPQNGVTTRVAILVVHSLKIINIPNQQREETLIAMGAEAFFLGAFLEITAITETGKFVLSSDLHQQSLLFLKDFLISDNPLPDPNPCFEFDETKRLDQVVGRSQFEAFDLIFQRAFRRRDDDVQVMKIGVCRHDAAERCHPERIGGRKYFNYQ